MRMQSKPSSSAIPFDQVEAIIKPFCDRMFKMHLDHEPIDPSDEGILNYICTHSLREIAQNMSAHSIDYKNKYSIAVYNRAIEFNRKSI